MTNRFASPLSLIVAAILGGLVSQGISRWMPEAQAQEGTKVQDEIRVKRLYAEEVRVVDADGKEGIVLSTAKGHSLMGMLTPGTDMKTSPFSLMVGVYPTFASLALLEKGHARLGLEVKKGGVTQVNLYESTAPGRQRLSARLDPDGSPSLVLLDGERARAVLGVTLLDAIKTGEKTMTAPSALNLFDKDGKVIWQAP